MPVGPRRRAICRSRLARGHSEAGFSLIEVIVAIGLIGIVMGSLGTFFVNSLVVTSAQAGRQVGVQLANDGMELVRSIRGSNLPDGRGLTAMNTQWSAALAGTVPGVKAYLETDTNKVSDPDVPYLAGADAALPTSPVTKVINGITYQQHWYVGQCWQAAAGGACGVAKPADAFEFFRAIVAVTWSEKTCPASSCSYVTATLVSTAGTDPIFDETLAPLVGTPAPQFSYAGISIDPLTLQFEHGDDPFTWAASGLPSGVSLNTATGVISGTPSSFSVGSRTVSVSLTDSLGRSSPVATFVWQVALDLLPATPAGQSSAGGVEITPLTLTATRGFPPYTWSEATGLPTGLTMSSGGVISGTPTVVESKLVTAKVMDANGRQKSISFFWSIPALALETPPDQADAPNAALTRGPANATGGISPYTWTASNLPTGLTINASTGVVSGTPTVQGTRTVTLTVTDKAGTARSTTFVWTIAAVNLVSPGNQTNTAGLAITPLTPTRTGGTAPYAFTQTGLPAGLSLNATTGTISGTPTSVGTASVTVRVTDAVGQQSAVAFTWTRPALTLSTPASQTSDNDIFITPLQLNVAGGVRPYTWTNSGLPAGLSIDANGRISGRATTANTYSVRIRVTDSSGATVLTSTFTWRVTN